MKNFEFSPEMQALLALICLGCAPKAEFGQPGMQARSKSGVPKWVVEVRSRTLGESIKVTVTSPTEPDVAEFAPITFDGLVLGATQTGSFWWSAHGVLTSAASKAAS